MRGGSISPVSLDLTRLCEPRKNKGPIAQLVERYLRKVEVPGAIPGRSIRRLLAAVKRTAESSTGSFLRLAFG